MSADRPWAAVPAEVGDLVRPHLDAVVAAVIAAVRAEVPEYDQPLEGEFGRLISEGTGRALVQFVELLGRDEDLPDLATPEALGHAEQRAGRTLDALQSAYRVGARVAWRQASGFGAENGIAPEVLYRLAEAIFAYIDRLAAASVAGFAQAASLEAGSTQARRHALVELLVAPSPPDPLQLTRAAAAAGWSPPERLAVLATDSDVVALARRMPPGTIAAELAPVGLLVVPDPDGPGQLAVVEAALRGRRAALGPVVAVAHAHRSAERARSLWALGPPGDAVLVRAEDHRLALLLGADPALAGELAAARLAPLEALGEGARRRALETLQAWLDAHGDVSAAADALHVHPQTVRYRLGGLREAFGGALEDPRARLELQLALYAASSSGAGSGSATGRRAGSGPPPGSA